MPHWLDVLLFGGGAGTSPRALAFSVAFAAVIGAGCLVFSPPRLRLPLP